MKWKSALGVLAILIMPAVASASTITWDFGSYAGDLGTSEVYTSGGVSITATAVGNGNPHLYGKADGGDENGLGIKGTDDNEIINSKWVQLDLNNLLSGYDTFKFSMNSATDGEQWQVCFSSVAGSFGSTNCSTGTSEGVNLLGNTLSKRYFSIQAIGTVDCGWHCEQPSNVLLHTFSANTAAPVPEPGSMVLLGGGLLSLGRRLRKRLA